LITELLVVQPITIMSQIILNVGGTLFYPSKEVLMQSGYFRALFERWSGETTTHIVNRPGIVFSHVLALLYDAEYRYPEEHLQELEYYAIDIEPNIEPSSSTLIKKLDKYERQIRELKDNANNCAVRNCRRPRFPCSKYCFNHADFVEDKLSLIRKNSLVMVRKKSNIYKVAGSHGDEYILNGHSDNNDFPLGAVYHKQEDCYSVKPKE
jgi:hypothetical protein